MNSVEIQVC